MSRAAFGVIVFTTVLLLSLSTPLIAQRDMGTILGVVKDQSGGVLPGATVRITEENTGLSVTVLTDDVGNYIRPLLKPGDYAVEVESTSFKKAVQKNVRLNPGERVAVDIVLQIGETSETL